MKPIDDIQEVFLNTNHYGTFYSTGRNNYVDGIFTSPIIPQLTSARRDYFTQCFDIFWGKFALEVSPILNFGFAAMPSPFIERLVYEINSCFGDDVVFIKRKLPIAINVKENYERPDSWEIMKNVITFSYNRIRPNEEIELNGGFPGGSYQFFADFKKHLNNNSEKRIASYLVHHIIRMASLYEMWNSKKETMERFFSSEATSNPIKFIADINNKEAINGYNYVRILSEIITSEREIKNSLSFKTLSKLAVKVGQSPFKQTGIILCSNRINDGGGVYLEVKPGDFLPIVRIKCGFNQWEIDFGHIDNSGNLIFTKNAVHGSRDIVSYGSATTTRVLTIEEFVRKTEENDLKFNYIDLLRGGSDSFSIQNNVNVLIDYMKKNPVLYKKEEKRLQKLLEDIKKV